MRTLTRLFVVAALVVGVGAGCDAERTRIEVPEGSPTSTRTVGDIGTDPDLRDTETDTESSTDG